MQLASGKAHCGGAQAHCAWHRSNQARESKGSFAAQRPSAPWHMTSKHKLSRKGCITHTHTHARAHTDIDACTWL